MPKRVENSGGKGKEFRPQVRSARTIIDAIAFLQKTGFAATPANIKTCILQRSRKPADHTMENLLDYLNRGLELGILKKQKGNYKLGNLEKTRRRRNVKGQKGVRKVKTSKSLAKARAPASRTGPRRLPR